MSLLRRIAVGLLALVVVLALASGADAQRRRRRRNGPTTGISVRVIDVSGDRAYLEPGTTGGLRRGARVTIGRGRFEVVGVTASYGVIAIDRGEVSVGDSGRAVVSVEANGEEVAQLTPPRPLSAYNGQWPDVVLPSATQHPEHVPLGVTAANQRLQVALSSYGGAYLPLGGQGSATGRADLRGRIHAEPIAGVPFMVDADAALQIFAAENLSDRPGAASQPYLRVRQLTVAYGDQTDFYAALGRLRYAANMLGPLDGLRVQSPSFQGLTVAAFGGFIPDPLDNKPQFQATRFGLEAQLRDPASELRPMISLVGSGSVYEGALDERRVTALVGLYPGDVRIGGHAELNVFDADNEWNAKEFELTAAGVDGNVRFGSFHVGARLDYRRPERSRFLASYLPRTFLCARGQGTSTPDLDPCTNVYEPRLLGSVDAGFDFDHFAVAAGGTAIHVGGLGNEADVDQLGGFVSARAVRIAEILRADLTAMVSTGWLIETFALRASVGVTLLDDMLDVSLHYRPALTTYEADIERYLEHMVGAAIYVTPTPEFDITLDVDALTSRDADALLLMAGIAWHPSIGVASAP
jgi:hypothetical protein